MHILLVADGRSPITRNWLRMLSGLDHTISLVSTYPYEPISGIARQYTLPVAFSAMSGSQVAHSTTQRQARLRGMVARLRPLLLKARALAAPLLLPRQQKEFLRILDEVQPDLVHALRVPFEGMLAAAAPADIPLIVSIWGNDLTFHARTSFLMKRQTRRTLARADGLLADASRDVRLAFQWGLRAGTPTAVLPGNGGLDLEDINRTLSLPVAHDYVLPEGRPLVVNPRGFRPGSVHQDVFFASIPLILKEFPQAYFVCTAMQGQPQALKWVEQYHLQEHVLLLPYLGQQQLWQLFSRAQVYVTLSSHDGTPNTFLEALACGCFPVVGDIESLREWLEPDRTGLLVDPHDPRAAAQAVLRALRHPELRERARQGNIRVLKQRAEVNGVRREALIFYNKFSRK
jgi:glycosyltransferase involved in cell wall biosynthesis